MQTYHHLVNNEAMPAASGQHITVLDPSTGDTFAQIARGTQADIDRAVQAAQHAFDGDSPGSATGVWGTTTALERGRFLMRLAAKISEHVEELAQLESRDTGKPIRQGRADATALSRYFEFYGGAADKLHGQTLPYMQGYSVLTLREPHGVTGHIIPWNYPMQIFGRSVGAALAAGNACVVKPAEDACLSLLRVTELAYECGLANGALNIVTGFGHEAGQALTEHHGIDHISFTGSGPTGQRVSNAAATHHCPVTMELGGKSAQLLFADADLDTALPVVVNAIIQNGGQTCSAGSRVLVEKSIYPEVLKRLQEAFSGLVSGAAMEDHDLGPMVNAKQHGLVSAYLEKAKTDGITISAQGSVDPGAPQAGYYLQATLLSNVPGDHALAREEVFGPVLVITPFEDEADAIRLSNATPYGLVTGVWTANGGRQLRVAKKIRSGQVFINNYGAGGGVELPFGGMKQSGYGREKGFEALYGFTTLKTIAIKHD